jgi:membrane protease YdiL (CAAX protease family)
MDQKEKLSLPGFLILLFIVSWIGALPMVLYSYKIRLPGALRILQVLMLFGPGLVAVYGAWRNGGGAGVRSLLKGLLIWRVSPRWYIGTFFGPIVLLLASLLISNLLGVTKVILPSANKFLSVFCMTFVIYFFLNTEELAWRGYVLPRLLSRFDAVRATVVLGVLWFLFHLPLFFIRGGHPAGYPLWAFGILILSLSFAFTAVYIGTYGSILLVHILHQSMNASAEALPVYPVASHSVIPVLLSAVLFLLSFVISGGRRKLKPRF